LWLTGDTVTDNSWHHVALVRYGDDIRLYLDGVSGAAGALPYDQGLNNVSPTTFAIGRAGGYDDYYYTGFMHDFRVAKAARYTTTGFTPPTGDSNKAGFDYPSSYVSIFTSGILPRPNWTFDDYNIGHYTPEGLEIKYIDNWIWTGSGALNVLEVKNINGILFSKMTRDLMGEKGFNGPVDVAPPGC